MSDDRRERHPSYGVIGFSKGRSSRPVNLVGCHTHECSVISLRIREANRIFYGGYDERFHGDQMVVEVDMSEMQFAQLISGLNVGDGVPCTIRYRQTGPMERVEEPPKGDLRERFGEHLRDQLEGTVESLNTLMSRIKEVRERPTKLGLDDLSKMAAQIQRELRANIPFTFEQFDEALNEAVTSAKIQIDAHVRERQAAGYFTHDEMKLQIEGPVRQRRRDK